MLLITWHKEHYSCSVAEKEKTVLNCYRFNQFLTEGIMHSLYVICCFFVLICGFFPSVMCIRIQLLF